MVARIEEKWSVACSHIDSVVCRKLCKCQMLTPTSKSPFDIRSQKILHGLNHLFALSISLQMKRCAEMKIRTEQFEQRFPKLAGETGIPIRNYHL